MALFMCWVLSDRSLRKSTTNFLGSTSRGVYQKLSSFRMLNTFPYSFPFPFPFPKASNHAPDNLLVCCNRVYPFIY